MQEVILSDYFYGAESEEFIYFKIPRLLITDQKFKHVSTNAKLLYGMLLNRMSLSAKNGWHDDAGRCFRCREVGKSDFKQSKESTS